MQRLLCFGSERDKNKKKEKLGCFSKFKRILHNIGEKIDDKIGFGRPTADVCGVHLQSISLEKIEIVVDVLIANPNPIPIPLVDITYSIDSEERKLIYGRIPDKGTISAHGSETVKILVTLVYDTIKSTYDDIKPGSIIPYKVKVDVIFDVPIIGDITIPLEKSGEIPIPNIPDIDVEKIHFHEFSFEETVAAIHLKLENKNEFDLGLTKLKYELWLSENSVGSVELIKCANIPKNGTTKLEIPITFRPKEFGSAVWDMICGGGASYCMRGEMDVDSPFGLMKLPISKEGGTTNFQGNNGDGDGDHEGYNKWC